MRNIMFLLSATITSILGTILTINTEPATWSRGLGVVFLFIMHLAFILGYMYILEKISTTKTKSYCNKANFN